MGGGDSESEGGLECVLTTLASDITDTKNKSNTQVNMDIQPIQLDFSLFSCILFL